ncbi:MAG: hypothetical protein RIQ79_796, partial [Verrucomicrobiota bacterium]
FSSDHAYPSDLEITLRAPSGRNVVVAYRPDLDYIWFEDREVTGFAGQNPNGRWTLLVRDVAAADIGAVTVARLSIVAR